MRDKNLDLTERDIDSLRQLLQNESLETVKQGLELWESVTHNFDTFFACLLWLIHLEEQTEYSKTEIEPSLLSSIFSDWPHYGFITVWCPSSDFV